MMKRILSFLLTVFMSLTFMTACSAEEVEGFTLTMTVGSPTMTVNGEEKEIDPGRSTCPVILNNRTLVPVRAAAEEMGGTVLWEGTTQTVTLTKDSTEIKLVIGSNRALRNGDTEVLDTSPVIIDDRTMLPIRFIAESFGYNVDWNGDNQMIIITENITEPNEEEPITENTPQEDAEPMTNLIEITIGNEKYKAELYDNDTAAAFAAKLPMTIDMSEMNGNEFYYYIDSSLPTASARPTGINTGDIKLYGSNCLVIFYKSFSTSYTYTDIGYIENPAGLENALKKSSGQVKIERSF